VVTETDRPDAKLSGRPPEPGDIPFVMASLARAWVSNPAPTHIRTARGG